ADALEAALAPDVGAAPPWPLFRGDAARTGFRPSPGPVTALAPVWDVALGPVIASPVLTARLVIAASADGRLHFLERATGRRPRPGGKRRRRPSCDRARARNPDLVAPPRRTGAGNRGRERRAGRGLRLRGAPGRRAPRGRRPTLAPRAGPARLLFGRPLRRS